MKEWWRLHRKKRAQRALVRQLEYQENKAQRFLDNGIDPSKGMAQRSLNVRTMLDNVQKIKDDARVLEVGSGAHGLIFFFDAPHCIGLDPLAHHYVHLFPGWQRRVQTVSGYGEHLPFSNGSFDIILTENVVDHVDDPRAILEEIARVLSPSGTLYFSVNISHPLYNMLSHGYGLLKALGLPFEINDFEDHPTHLSLSKARQFLNGLPLRIVREHHTISENRKMIMKRQVRRLKALVRSIFYFQASYYVVAVRD